METIFLVISLCVLAVATFTDIKYGKVYWWLTLPAIAFGLVSQLFCLSAVEYILRVACIVGIYFVYEGFIGGGDAKLLMMLVIFHGIIPGLLTLGIATLAILCIVYIKDPQQARASIQIGFLDWTTKNLTAHAGQGATVLLAPYMFASFLILAVVFGLH